jgi:hypothetical protein
MAYSCDGMGIYEARSELEANAGTTVFSRAIASGGTVPPAPTTNTSGWSDQCKADAYFVSIQEATGMAVEP